MFILTNSGGQIFVNLRKETKRIKTKKKLNFFLSAVRLPFYPFPYVRFLLLFFFILYVGPICPFIPFLGPFQLRNNLFCLGFNFLYPN